MGNGLGKAPSWPSHPMSLIEFSGSVVPLGSAASNKRIDPGRQSGVEPDGLAIPSEACGPLRELEAATGAFPRGIGNLDPSSGTAIAETSSRAFSRIGVSDVRPREGTQLLVRQ